MSKIIIIDYSFSTKPIITTNIFLVTWHLKRLINIKIYTLYNELSSIIYDFKNNTT